MSTATQNSTLEDAKGKAKAAANEVVSDTQSKVSETKEYVKSQVTGVKDSVVGEAKGAVRQGKSQIASQIGGIASAFHQASEQMGSEDATGLSSYTSRLGEQVQSVADYMEGRDLGEMVRDVEGFARRQPATFIGLSLIAGIAAARFLRSSTPQGSSVQRSEHQRIRAEQRRYTGTQQSGFPDTPTVGQSSAQVEAREVR